MAKFEQIKKVFFEALRYDPKQAISRNPVIVLRESLSDKDPITGDIASLTVRHKLVFDDTPDGSLARFVQSLMKNVTLLYGSFFPNDKSDAYDSDIVSRAILAMETGKVCLLSCLSVSNLSSFSDHDHEQLGPRL